MAEPMIDLTDAALRQRALVLVDECLTLSNVNDHIFEGAAKDANGLCCAGCIERAFIALRDAARREQAERDAKIADAEGAEYPESYCEQADTYDPVAAGNVSQGNTARCIAEAIRKGCTSD